MRKTIEFIPYEMQNIKDFQDVANAVDEYYDIKVEELNQLKFNRDILTADEETIAMYERLCKITPSATATLDDRRFAVWLKRTTHTPFTEQWLRHWLNEHIGEYELDFGDYHDNAFILKLGLSKEKDFETISTLLDEVVPAHLLYVISWLFNTWQEAYEKYNWETANVWTWEDAYKNNEF